MNRKIINTIVAVASAITASTIVSVGCINEKRNQITNYYRSKLINEIQKIDDDGSLILDLDSFVLEHNKDFSVKMHSESDVYTCTIKGTDYNESLSNVVFTAVYEETQLKYLNWETL